jgi:hypothetical protein
MKDESVPLILVLHTSTLVLSNGLHFILHPSAFILFPCPRAPGCL